MRSNFNFSQFTRNLSQNYNIEPDKLKNLVQEAEISKRKIIKIINIAQKPYRVIKTGIGPIKTKYGNFYQMVFKVKDENLSYFVVIKSDIDKNSMLPVFNENEDIFLRIDSGCVSGQVFHDLNCDCREQLEIAMEKLSREKQGLIIHIPNQDGRGKGTDFKLATLYLQEQIGINTIEAFTLLEKDNRLENLDCRKYEGAVTILKFLDIKSRIIMGTNNPLKLKTLEENGFEVKQEPILAEVTAFTARHLEAKKKALGHILGV